MEKIIESFCPEDTEAAAAELAREAVKGDCICLSGDLGVGKTLFAQGFAKGLGIEAYINSPTFTILQVYEGGRLPFYHMDVYRLEGIEELEEIGFDEYIYGDGVSLIEWADMIEEALPVHRIRVEISKAMEKGTEYRRIIIRQEQEGAGKDTYGQ